ncbi:MAG: hypothetical protein HY952_03610 [Elusimicrobia bacterium]|nr:hypothetical protein [Elusimicrobiota bacterium]
MLYLLDDQPRVIQRIGPYSEALNQTFVATPDGTFSKCMTDKLKNAADISQFTPVKTGSRYRLVGDVEKPTGGKLFMYITCIYEDNGWFPQKLKECGGK